MTNFCKKIIQLLTTIVLLQFICTSAVSANPCHSHRTGRTENALVPDFRFDLDPKAITDRAAFSAFGEVGARNCRLNMTGGFLVEEVGCLKASWEYLHQRLGYRFRSGKHTHWMDQFAIGAGYQHQICGEWLSDLEFSGYYSYAPGRNPRKIRCVRHHGFVTEKTVIFRHIAGSTAYGVTLGGTFFPWCSASLRIECDYDHVRYRQKFHKDKIVSGYGGGFNLYQQLAYFGLGLQADFRRPFNYFKGMLCWNDPIYCQGMNVNLFCSYTRGKSRLPNSTVAGVEITYDLGGPPLIRSKCVPGIPPSQCCDPRLACWIAKTAVYLPQVLAIPEDRVRKTITVCPGVPVISGGGIPDQIFCGIGTFVINAGSFFSNPTGANSIVFSATGLPAGSSINATTGVISGPALETNSASTVVVTATNNCGSTSQCFALGFVCLAPTSTTLPDVSESVTSPTFTIQTATAFLSPCGQPFTFSATGLPAGSSINPTTGAITGTTTGLAGESFSVVVLGTTVCGSTSQQFLLSITD